MAEAFTEAAAAEPPPPPAALALLLLLLFCCLFLVLILEGDSSLLLVRLESLSHSLASSSVRELFSSLETAGDERFAVSAADAAAVAVVAACGSGVSSFLGGVLLARVTRLRRKALCLRRRCGRLLLAPGVFFHR